MQLYKIFYSSYSEGIESEWLSGRLQWRPLWGEARCSGLESTSPFFNLPLPSFLGWATPKPLIFKSQSSTAHTALSWFSPLFCLPSQLPVLLLLSFPKLACPHWRVLLVILQTTHWACSFCLLVIATPDPESQRCPMPSTQTGGILILGGHSWKKWSKFILAGSGKLRMSCSDTDRGDVRRGFTLY